MEKLWKEFEKKCAKEGFVPNLSINLKEEIAPGITPREKKLIEIIVNTYLEPKVIFNKK